MKTNHQKIIFIVTLIFVYITTNQAIAGTHSAWSVALSINNTTAVTSPRIIKSNLAGFTITPNPAIMGKEISIQIKGFSQSSGIQNFSIYSVKGSLLACWDMTDRNVHSTISWNGRTIDGNIVPVGLYIVCLKTKNQAFTQSLTLVR